MKYREIADGIFVDRPNRFIAHVGVNGAVETVHVKNTGRCKELLLPGTAVRLEVSDNPKRKTKYDLVAVHKQGLGWVNMDSQAPNKVVGEWLSKQGFDLVRPEFAYGKSRIDFYMEKGERKYLLEVKGCTLEVGGIGYFPDAPTERGVKHLPVAELSGSTLTVTVGAVEHPMVDVHHIQWLFVETENGGQLRYLAPGQAPKAVFELGSEKPVAVYAYCNLHGLWTTKL